MKTFVSWNEIPENFRDDELEAREWALSLHVKRGGNDSPWAWVDEDGIGFADEHESAYGAESSVEAGGLLKDNW